MTKIDLDAAETRKSAKPPASNTRTILLGAIAALAIAAAIWITVSSFSGGEGTRPIDNGQPEGVPLPGAAPKTRPPMGAGGAPAKP